MQTHLHRVPWGPVSPGSTLFGGDAKGTVALTGMSSTFTISYWVKEVRTAASTADFHVSGLTNGNGIAVRDTGQLSWYDGTSHNDLGLVDLSGLWAHICLVSDAGSASLYFNGAEVATGLDTSGMGSETGLEIGADSSAGHYFAGLMKDFYFINDAALPVSMFGHRRGAAWDIRQPASIFADGASGYWPDLSTGADQSGNGNNLTTSGALTDLEDSQSDDKKGDVGCPAILNPLDVLTAWTAAPTKGNLRTPESNGAVLNHIGATLAFTQPKYWEATYTLIAANAHQYMGAGPVVPPATSMPTAGGWFFSPHHDGVTPTVDGYVRVFTDGSVSPITPFVCGDGSVFMFHFNPVTGNGWAGADGVWFDGGDPDTEANPTWTGLPAILKPYYATLYGHVEGWMDFNFGQFPFVHTPPAEASFLSTAAAVPGDLVVAGTSDEGNFVYTGGLPASVTWDSTTYDHSHDGSVIRFHATGFTPQSGAGSAKAWTAVIETPLGARRSLQPRAFLTT